MTSFTTTSRRRRILVVGLDSMAPELAFDQWPGQLPTLARLMAGGTYGRLESIIPPITVPAWACMMASLDPGQFGIYGFRNRADYSYEKMTIANANAINAPMVWDMLGQAGQQAILVGVPPSYPVKPVNGCRVGCFLTPSTRSAYTYPPELKEEIAAWVGDYLVDAEGFRTEDKTPLLKMVYTMTEKRFTVLKHLIAEKPWDFFMFVEIGVDRMHHGFWKDHDPLHPRHNPASPYKSAIRDYYVYLDRQLGELLALAGDDTVILVVSDHGAQRMDGGICLNEWLRREGYLVLKEPPAGRIPLEKAEIDWHKTRAWGGGGYYGRLFLNVAGREPEGIIPPAQYEAVRDELITRISAIPDPQGRPIPTRVWKPQQLYRQVNGIAPDLIIHFGNLSWRSVGTLGHDSLYTFENDTGPDDANHSQFGLFILYDPRQPGRGRVADEHLYNVAPTILKLNGLPIPTTMIGRPIAKF